MDIWTAFVIGFLGSFHCIGMCGPIAAALPGGFQSKYMLVLSRLLYNGGRTITYALLGILSGAVGQSAAMIGWQQSLSILLGSIIVLSVAASYLARRRGVGGRYLGAIKSRLKRLWAWALERRGLSSLFVVGLLNGFLPCGLVYVAMAAAASTGNIVSSMTYMIMFGLGVTPVMLAVSLFGQFLPVRVKHTMVRLIPVAGLLVGGLLILRGMSLGIPYVSPNINVQTHSAAEPGCH
jgi:sulfite exporter TauE/SafE